MPIAEIISILVGKCMKSIDVFFVRCTEQSIFCMSLKKLRKLQQLLNILFFRKYYLAL